MTGDPSFTPPKLLDQVRDRRRVKHYSIQTETQYLQWIRRFILFHDKRQPSGTDSVDLENQANGPEQLCFSSNMLLV